KQQFLLEHEQVLVEFDDVLFDALHFLIQGLEIGGRRARGCRRRLGWCGGRSRSARRRAGCGGGALAAAASAAAAPANSIAPTMIETTRDLRFISGLSFAHGLLAQ